VILLTALAAVTAWVVFRPGTDPVYQGRRLSSWGKAAARTNVVALDSQFLKGVEQTGTDAIPVLLNMVRAHDTRWKMRLLRLLRKQDFIRFDPPKSDRLNDLGYGGFAVLGKRGKAALPDLIRITEGNYSPTSEFAAITSLQYLGSDARAAVPVLVRQTESTNGMIRAAAIAALISVRDSSPAVVAALVDRVDDSSDPVKIYAFEGLRQFAPDAKSAVPKLEAYIRGTSNNSKPAPNAAQARKGAILALKAIDPASAAALATELKEGW